MHEGRGKVDSSSRSLSPLEPLHQLFNRRDLLRVGALSVAGTALPHLSSTAHATAIGPGKAKSVIYLWMAGGVTHIDSFDPKPTAPVEIRGTLSDIATNMPGVRFCETVPEMAKIADQLALIRSFSHGSNDHLVSQVYTLSGHKVDMNGLYSEPNIGSMVSHLHGSRNGLPGYIAVPGITRPGPPPYNFFVGGWLGSRHAPYCLGGFPEEPDFTVPEKVFDPPSKVEEDWTPGSLRVPTELSGRLHHRARLRDQLDGALRSLEESELIAAAETKYQSALKLLTTPQVRAAFDISVEPDKLRDTYGRTKIGGRCLLARRLVEAGARFVMVDYGYDPEYGNIWDNHNAPVQKHPPIQQMVKRGYHLAGMDKAFAALITDLRDRGMLDSTLVVFITEFGRTPRINARGGRDHWGPAGSLFFTGGGTRTGQVIGKTNKTAAEPVTHGYSPADIAATIYTALGINPHQLVRDFQGRPRPILDHGSAIPEVL